MKERKVFLCLGSNREITYCTMEDQARRPQDYGRPVFAVETIEQAKALQVYFCALNRDGSGRYHFVDKNTRDVDAEDVWKNGSFPTMVIKAFDAHFDNHYGGPEQIHQALSEKWGGTWEIPPDYSWDDWKMEVINNETRSSYWDWVRSKIEQSIEGKPL